MKLIWTDPSIEDLRAVRDYIARDSDYYAANFVEQVVLSVERLCDPPNWAGWFQKPKMKTFASWCIRITASPTG